MGPENIVSIRYLRHFACTISRYPQITGPTSEVRKGGVTLCSFDMYVHGEMALHFVYRYGLSELRIMLILLTLNYLQLNATCIILFVLLTVCSDVDLQSRQSCLFTVTRKVDKARRAMPRVLPSNF